MTSNDFAVKEFTKNLPSVTDNWDRLQQVPETGLENEWINELINNENHI